MQEAHDRRPVAQMRGARAGEGAPCHIPCAMASPDRYPVPAERARAELVIERSRFICTVARAETPEA